jgi:amino acid permease
MIQRKQTVYLLITVIMAFTYIAMNPVICSIKGKLKDQAFQEVENELLITFKMATFAQEGRGVAVESGNSYLTFTLWVLGSLGLLTILLFKQRKLQLRLASYLLIFDLMLLFLIYFEHSNKSSLFIDKESSWTFFAFAPLILIPLHVLALRGIIHDIQLLKSVDRLR